MRMEFQDMPDGVTRIVLEGDLDAAGATEIDERLCEIAGSRGKVIVDMARVGLLADRGTQTLVRAAKANAGRGGKLILLAPEASVWDVIVTCGAVSALPAAYDFEAAIASLR